MISHYDHQGIQNCFNDDWMAKFLHSTPAGFLAGHGSHQNFQNWFEAFICKSVLTILVPLRSDLMWAYHKLLMTNLYLCLPHGSFLPPFETYCPSWICHRLRWHLAIWPSHQSFGTLGVFGYDEWLKLPLIYQTRHPCNINKQESWPNCNVLRLILCCNGLFLASH